MAHWASVAGSKIICEEVVIVIESRGLEGPGVGEGWVSSLINHWGAPEWAVYAPENLCISGPAELALLITRILKHRRDAQPSGT